MFSKAMHFTITHALLLGSLMFSLSACGGSESAHGPDPMTQPAENTQISADGKSQKAIITVNHGYAPAHVRAKAGIPLTLEFFRNEETPSCAKDIQIPELKQTFSIANQGTHTVSVPAQKPGKLTIQCTMKMMHGVVEIQ